MRRFLERLLNLLRVRRPDRDLAREIAAHAGLLQDGYEKQGLSPEAARRVARLALGNVEQIKAQHREARSFRVIEDAAQDAVHALRLLRRSPVFAATAALSLAIGIGANTAIFTVADALLFRPPAGIADPSALVIVGAGRGDGGVNPINYTLYLDIARRTTTLSGMFAEEMFPHVMGMALSGTGIVEPVVGRYVSANFFGALGASVSRGRGFGTGDEAAAVLDYDYWRRRFNGDEAMIGQVLRLNGRPVTIVGVASPDFHGTGIQKCDAWLSIGAGASGRSVLAGGRLRHDVSFDTAAAELRAVGQTLTRDQGRSGDEPRQVNALPFSRAGANRNIVGGFAAALMVLVSLVLAVACANVAGIMLTRANARAGEIALRAALGAGRGRLVRQLLTETIVLALCSGLIGIGLARAIPRVAIGMLPPLPASLVVPLTMDWRVLLFALSLSMAAAAGFGVLPALRGSRTDAGSLLKDGVRSSSGRSRLRGAFVVGQIACSVLLVVLGASFVRVLRHAGAADPGFDPHGVDLATLDVSVTGDPKAGTPAFWASVIDRIRETPAVESASLARVPPGGLEGIGLGSLARSDRPGPAETFVPAWNIVDSGYFATLSIPVFDGRDFSPADAGGPPVVIVSETLARRFWPGQRAVGRLLRLEVFSVGAGRVVPRIATVVSVVGNVRSTSLVDGVAEPYVYLPLAQADAMGLVEMTAQMSIVARRRGEASVAAAAATIVQGLDPRLVLTRAESLADAIAFGLTAQRTFATVGGVMGFVALLLASMGIYGVTAYTVALRRREFAIRLALGAPRARILQMVIGHNAWLVAAGLGIGLTLAVGVVQVLSVFFYGLPASHAPTLLGIVALFLVIGGAASIVPAGQAVGKEWRRALQEE